jgi:hypothetical protein
VVVEATVSLDGFIAGPNESGSERLFAWFAGGDMTFPSWNPSFQIRLTEPDYRYMRDVNEGIGVRDRAPHVRPDRRLGRPAPVRQADRRRHALGAPGLGRYAVVPHVGHNPQTGRDVPTTRRVLRAVELNSYADIGPLLMSVLPKV